MMTVVGTTEASLSAGFDEPYGLDARTGHTYLEALLRAHHVMVRCYVAADTDRALGLELMKR